MDELIKHCYEDYIKRLKDYETIQKYYRNDSDVIIQKSELIPNTTEKIKHNYFKKFVKNEANYILGNKVTYTALGDNKKQVEDTNYYLSHWDEDHDLSLFRRGLTYGKTYELYYVDDDLSFCSKKITPLNGYAHIEDGRVKLFLNVYKKKFDDAEYMDVITETEVISFKDQEKVGEGKPHNFAGVPIGICDVSDGEKDILFEDIKTIQDAYERNISDMSLELTQYRLAYLKVINAEIKDEDLPKMREKGILQVNGKDANIDWLIKNINDTFIKNTTQTLKQNMYELACHINNNEQVPSNNSSLAMRTRQLELENKCISNIKAFTNLLKTRVKYLYQYLKRLHNKTYDYRMIEPKFTVSLPQDDLMIAQILSQVPEGYISRQTGSTQFSFIDNVENEKKLIESEGEKYIQEGLKLLEAAKAGEANAE